MARLEALGNATVRQRNAQNGAGENQFGVKLGDLRTLAKSIKTDHALALALWETGNLDAMFLATLLFRPRAFSTAELDTMVRSTAVTWLADWLMTHVVKLHPEKEALRLQWMESSHPMAARAGWSLTAERVVKSPEGLDFVALLDRIEAELIAAPLPAQWTMNYCLAELGIQFPVYRERAIAIGERLGVYRDYPTPKGCTSPFAPSWIRALVARQG